MAYFVRIENAPELRRHLLASSKDLIQVLKGYQRLLDLRDQKRDLVLELQHTIVELNLLLAELEKVLPERSLKEVEQFLPKAPRPAAHKKAKKEPQQAVEAVSTDGAAPAGSPEAKPGQPAAKPKKKAVEKAEKPVVPKAPPRPKPLTELERLEHALKNIDERLQQLS